MSIIDEITRIQNAKAKLKLNLENKGVSVGDEKLDVMVDFVSDIKGGIDTTDGTATSNDILLGKTAYVNDEKIEGTIETYNSEMTDGAEIINNTLDITANGEYDVTQYGKANVNVEAKFELELTYTKISEHSFEGSNITSVRNENATTISFMAFANCSKLENIYTPNVTKIEQKAFKNCINLKEVRFPKVTQISSSLFESSGLKSAWFDTIPEFAGGGGFWQFRYCNDLTDIYFGYQGVVSIWTTSVFADIPKGVRVHVRSEYAEQYATATNWTSLIANGTIVIVGDYVD